MSTGSVNTIPDLSRLKVSPPKTVRTDSPAPVQELDPIPPDLLDNFDDPGILSPAPAPKSPELVQKEEEARVIISLYKVKFPDELAVLGPELEPICLAQMDLAQLEVLRDRCDKLLGAGSGCDNKKKLFNACLYAIEKIGCMGGIYCDGLTATLLGDRDYQKDVTRLALKYLSGSDCKPEITVPLKILTTAVQLHASNEIKLKQKVLEQQLSAPETSKKISDVDKQFNNIA